MLKKIELSDPNSCLNRARDDELVFVLLERDVAAPTAIRSWCNERIVQGKNKPGDDQITTAYACADRMEELQKRPGDPTQLRAADYRGEMYAPPGDHEPIFEHDAATNTLHRDATQLAAIAKTLDGVGHDNDAKRLRKIANELHRLHELLASRDFEWIGSAAMLFATLLDGLNDPPESPRRRILQSILMSHGETNEKADVGVSLRASLREYYDVHQARQEGST